MQLLFTTATKHAHDVMQIEAIYCSSLPGWIDPWIDWESKPLGGAVGGAEDGVVGAGECADPEECKMIADLGVDMLAAGIGNIHGKYPENWAGLSFETLDAVQQKTGVMPLVLHGGTGIPEDMIKKAIDLGVSKINVNTECQLSFQEATRKYVEEGKDLQGKGFDPR